MPSEFPDLIDVLINVGSIIPVLIMVAQGILALIAYLLMASAFVELWGLSHDNTVKYLPGAQRYSYGSALVTMLISGLMLATSTLQMVGMLSRTLTGDYAAERIMPSALSYSGGGLSEKAQVATLVLLSIMQAVGFYAISKGYFILNGRFNDTQPRQSVGAGLVFITGGVFCWNFKWFADVLNNQIGFNIIGLFAVW